MHVCVRDQFRKTCVYFGTGKPELKQLHIRNMCKKNKDIHYSFPLNFGGNMPKRFFSRQATIRHSNPGFLLLTRSSKPQSLKQPTQQSCLHGFPIRSLATKHLQCSFQPLCNCAGLTQNPENSVAGGQAPITKMTENGLKWPDKTLFSRYSTSGAPEWTKMRRIC